MREQVQQYVIENFGFLPPELVVIFISALPILELRGGLPIAYAYYEFSFIKSFLLSVFGNALPIIPLLLLFQPMSNWMSRFKWYRRMYNWLYHRTMKKSKNVQRLGAVGLILFTAIPLPTTGAYSACVAAALLAINFRSAFIAIMIGIMIAGSGIGILSYSIW